jgi:hypothetical protein
MPGTLNVGGHDIITHSGTAGAGTINLVDQAGSTILTDSGSGMSISSNVAFPAGHVLQVLVNQNDNSFVGSGDSTAVWTDGSSALTVTINCVSANPKFLVIQTAGHSYNHSQTLYGSSYFRMKCDRDLIIYGSTLSANNYTSKQPFNNTNDNSSIFTLNYPSYQGSNHNDSGLKPTSVEYFFSTTNTAANTSFTFTPASFGNNIHGIHFPSITVMEIKS